MYGKTKSLAVWLQDMRGASVLPGTRMRRKERRGSSRAIFSSHRLFVLLLLNIMQVCIDYAWSSGPL